MFGTGRGGACHRLTVLIEHLRRELHGRAQRSQLGFARITVTVVGRGGRGSRLRREGESGVS